MRKIIIYSFTIIIFLLSGLNLSGQVTSATFGEFDARHIGPATMSGRVTSLDASEKDPRLVYVGSAAGGVWKSINAGVTFDPVFDNHCQSIGAIAMVQSNPDTVWVGTGEPWVRNTVSYGDGIYVTKDGGVTWIKKGLDSTERIGRIVIHPDNPAIIYVAAMGGLWGPNPHRGVYKTIDGGQTWDKVLYVNESTGCADITIDPDDPSILYAGMWEFRRKPWTFTSGGSGSGLYKTTDGGATWKRITNGLPDGELGRIAVDVSEVDPNIVYALIESENSALFRSDDKGITWQEVNSTPIMGERPFYFSYIVTDPVDTFGIYKPGFSLSRSTDGGKKFESLGGGFHSDVHAFWISPKDNNFIYMGTDGGIYISNDKARTWSMVKNLPLSQFYHVSTDMQKPYNIYGGLQDNGSWYGPSASPGGIENSDWKNAGYGDGFYVFPDKDDENIIYWQYQGGNIKRLYKDTRELKDIKPYPDESTGELRFNWDTPVAFGPNSNNMYVGAQYLYRSSNRGDTWERISPDLTTDDPEKQKQQESGGLTIDNSTAENHCTILSIAESSLDSNVIWVGTDDGNLQVSLDGGENWQNVVENVPDIPKNTSVSFIESGKFNRGTAYVTFDGHLSGDLNAYVYKTNDFGKTWENITGKTVQSFCHVIKEDLKNPDLLFLGTEKGLYLSVDQGENWSRLTGNFPPVPVFDMVIHPREHDLVVGTHGRGVFIIDDITPLRKITTETITEELKFLEGKPHIIKNYGYQQSFSGNDEFVGSNPPTSAMITYYMSKRHIFGKMYIEVFDENGDLVTELPAGKRKGVNRVPFATREKPPKVPPARTLAGGAMMGPALAAGGYTVKVYKKDKVFEGKITLAYDPDLPHTKEEMELQHQTVMKAYNMLEDLAFMVAGIDKLIMQVNNLLKANGLRPSLMKTLNSYKDKLVALKKELVDTGKTNDINDLNKLRDRITTIYGAVNGYMGKPTDSQISSLVYLESQLNAYQDDFEGLKEDQLVQVNKKLEKLGKSKIKVLTREEYSREED